MLAALLLSIAAGGTLAASLAEQRQLFTELERAARADPDGAWRLRAEPLKDYVLWPYVEYAALAARPKSTPAAQARAFLKLRATSPLAMRLRRAMLEEWSKQQRWSDVLTLDHADFGELLEYVERARPKVVYTLHGDDAFAAHLRQRGVDARHLLT